MTTPERAAAYEAAHIAEHASKGWAVYNPQDRPIEELPVIYGFNNGGAPGWMHAVLLAADGTELGNHACSSEGYMPHDLGILKGTRPDRHEAFRAHYPDGYRMEFVRRAVIPAHTGLMAAIEAAQARQVKEESQP